MFDYLQYLFIYNISCIFLCIDIYIYIVIVYDL